MHRALLPFLLAMLALAARADAALESAWLQAVTRNDTAALSRLLPDVDDVNHATVNGKTALMCAARSADVALADALLDAGADVGRENRAAGTALIYAAWSGHIGMIDLLLDGNARINHRAANGWTALMMAAAKQHAEAAGRLLERGAAVDVPDVYGWTPLMRAAYEGYSRVVEVLLAGGAPNQQLTNDHGQTALHLAVIGRNDAIARRLVLNGASATLPDFEGRNAIELAQSTAQTELVEYMKTRSRVEPDQH